MAIVHERWLSKRAVSLHVAALVVVLGCAVAAWWQVNRAQDGNTLSYFYSIMWPVFGLLGLYFWWLLIHTDYDSVGLKGMRRQQSLAQAPSRVPADPVEAADVVPTSPALPLNDTEATTVTEAPIPSPTAPDDRELAAYNERLAELAANGPKTWRNREEVVVRRAQ
jgi:hypothetical protein